MWDVHVRVQHRHSNTGIQKLLEDVRNVIVTSTVETVNSGWFYTTQRLVENQFALCGNLPWKILWRLPLKILLRVLRVYKEHKKWENLTRLLSSELDLDINYDQTFSASNFFFLPLTFMKLWIDYIFKTPKKLSLASQPADTFHPQLHLNTPSVHLMDQRRREVVKIRRGEAERGR